MIELFILFLLLFWLANVMQALNVMVKKGIEPSFWSVLFVILPIVNTYITIRYFRVDTSGFCGFRDFWKKLNDTDEDSNSDCVVEQKQTDKVEPKFKVGDWIVQGCNILKIRCVGNEYYCYETVMGYVDDMLVSEIDSLYHLWTIQDAKDGDVLACESGWTCIFKKLNHNSFGEKLFDSHCFINRTGWFHDGAKGHTLNERINGKIYPATKEQRDLLFKKMKEADYEWDAEKKELKKKSTEEYNITGIGSKHAQGKLGEMTKSLKPALSEEDEAVLDALIRKIEGEDIYVSNHLAVKCLKSIKDRYTWKPNNGQMKQLGWIAKQNKDNMIGKELMSLYNDLKKLREE